jgi:hypothetical protein
LGMRRLMGRSGAVSDRHAALSGLWKDLTLVPPEQFSYSPRCLIENTARLMLQHVL